MKETKLQRKDKISPREARELILTLAKYGNHSIDIEYFNNIVQKCREFQTPVPFFENLISSTWNILGSAKVTRVDTKTGQKDLNVIGPGTITISTYWTQYEEAENALDQTIENASFIKFHSALDLGIACIES